MTERKKKRASLESISFWCESDIISIFNYYFITTARNGITDVSQNDKIGRAESKGESLLQFCESSL